MYGDKPVPDPLDDVTLAEWRWNRCGVGMIGLGLAEQRALIEALQSAHAQASAIEQAAERRYREAWAEFEATPTDRRAFVKMDAWAQAVNLIKQSEPASPSSGVHGRTE